MSVLRRGGACLSRTSVRELKGLRPSVPGRQLAALALAAVLVAADGVPVRLLAFPGQPAPQGVPARAPLPPRPGIDPANPAVLTLDEIVKLALEQNADVAVARIERRAAGEEVRAAEGILDPRLIPSFGYQRTTAPVASVIGGGANGRVEETRATGGVQLDARSPWAGGRLTLDLSSTRVESTNQNLRLNPQFPASLGAVFVQPLLRGRGIDQERRAILLARRAADLSDVQLRRVLVEQLALVEQAYWDLTFAAGNLDVQANALAQARSQVESNERQARAGTLAPIDVVEAQTQVARFEQALATALQELTAAENRLKRLVLGDRSSPLWSRAIEPAPALDRPAPALTLEQAVTAALERRPEIEELQALAAQNEIDVRFFANQGLPQADLVASYSLAGLAGTASTRTSNPFGGSDAALLARLNELSTAAGLDPLSTTPTTTTSAVPGFLVGGYGDAFSNIWSRRFPTLSLQLQIELPIGNRTAAANLARSRLLSERVARLRTQAEQAIEAEVRDALQAIQSSQARLQAAGSARRNAQEQFDSERRRFEAGLSTVFLLQERQTALVTAQGQELRARADLNQAIVLFDRAVGNTLSRHGVAIDGQV